jgi:hypothetical protein
MIPQRRILPPDIGSSCRLRLKCTLPISAGVCSDIGSNSLGRLGLAPMLVN